MRRRSVLLIAFCCLALLGIGVAPWTLGSDYASQRIGKHVKALTGLDLTVSGRTTLAVLPVPRIKLEDVSLRSADGSVRLTTGQFRGEVRLLPLLRGELELSDVTLFDPTLRLTGEGSVLDAWLDWLHGLTRTAAASSVGRYPHVPRLVVVGGTVELPARAGQRRELTDLGAVFAWADSAGPITLAGQFSYADRPVEMNLSGLNPIRLSIGDSSDLSLRLRAGATALQGKGVLTEGGARFEGQVNFAADSLADADRWVGASLPFASLIDRFMIGGTASLSPRGLAISAADITIGEDHMEGALSGRLDGDRVALSGTLAADALDLSRFARPLTPRTEGDGSWSRDSIDAGNILTGDVDLRISAARATVGRFVMEDLATSVMLRGGRFEIALSRASAYRGMMKGRLILQPSDAGLDARLQGTLDRVDLGTALTDAFDLRRISGTGSLQLLADASGGSVADLARTLTGRGTVAVRQGALIGLDLGDLVRRAEQRPLSAMSEWRGGRTPFDQATATVTMAGGVMEFGDANLQGQNVKAAMSGQVSVADRTLALNGTVAAPAVGARTEVPVEFSGAWADPHLAPNIKALIRRSDAAAPLLSPVNAQR